MDINILQMTRDWGPKTEDWDRGDVLGELFNYAFEYILGLQARDKAAMLADKTIHFFTEFKSKKEFISWEFKSLAEGKLFCICQPTQPHDSCKLVIRMKFAPNEIDSRYYLL